MTEFKITSKVSHRVLISLLVIIFPVALLIKGIYGSFIFTFSIPILWQIGFQGNTFNSIGLRFKSIKSSIITGTLTGLIIIFLGGNFLRLLGITGHSFSNVDKLQFSLGFFKLTFPLQKELGYQLLNMSNTTPGLCIYLLFCIFVIGLGEEIFWRGFLQKKMSDHTSMDMAIWLTAVLFTASHFYIFSILPVNKGIYFLVLIALAGVCWGYLFKYFNNVWSAAISHGIVAFAIWKYYFFSY